MVKGIRFVCSDMWKPYLNVLAAEAGQALHVLDRFHITMRLTVMNQMAKGLPGRLATTKSNTNCARVC